ncbi:MAG: hypothetical protein K2N46_05335 [Lachnospiraceae bacterium]|nr:hypothetical protein [Lachnospiraceae bacterium]
MLDGYAWMMSEEIREYLRENYKLSFKERMQLVRTAYRPMEERMQALRMLQKEAVTPREKGFAAQVIRLYEFMLQEIRKSRPGQFYIRKLPCPAQGRAGMEPVRIFVYASYEEMLADIPDGEVWECGEEVEKWEIGENGVRELISFYLYPMDQNACIANTYLDDDRYEEAGVSRTVIKQENRFYDVRTGYAYRYPYPLPFSTGDLVRLDAPIYEEPLYGVMYSEDYGGQYVHMGIICEEEGTWIFDMLDLSELDIGPCSGLRVMDWLHRAKPEELPENREILGELAAYFTDLRRQGPEAIEEPFFWIFGCRREKSRDIRPFHVTPVMFPELIKALEEDMRQHFQKQGE